MNYLKFMKKRTQLFSMMGMLTLVTVSLMGTADASSLAGGFGNQMKERGLTDPIHQAIETGDYQAFLSAKKKTGRALAGISVSEAQFKRLTEAHALREAGKIAEADAIMKELGIEKPAQSGRGMKKGLRGQAHTQLTDVQKQAFTKAQELRKDGKIEEAQKVLTDAGIPTPFRSVR
jgi:hypothetical protein